MLIKWLLPRFEYKEEQEFVRAKVLTYTLLCALFFYTGLYIINTINPVNPDFPFIRIIGIALGLLLLLKITKSPLIVGSLFVAAYFIGLAFISQRTGGIFSRSLIFLFLVPMFAFIFTGFRSGFLWVFICALFSTMSY